MSKDYYKKGGERVSTEGELIPKTYNNETYKFTSKKAVPFKETAKADKVYADRQQEMPTE